MTLTAPRGGKESIPATRKRMGRSMKLANLAEAYLAVDPSVCMAMLQNPKLIIDQEIREMLIQIATVLLGDEGDHLVNDQPDRSSTVPFPGWNSFEVIAMVFAKWRNHLISKAGAELIFKILASHSLNRLEVTLPSHS